MNEPLQNNKTNMVGKNSPKFTQAIELMILEQLIAALSLSTPNRTVTRTDYFYNLVITTKISSHNPKSHSI